MDDVGLKDLRGLGWPSGQGELGRGERSPHLSSSIWAARLGNLRRTHRDAIRELAFINCLAGERGPAHECIHTDDSYPVPSPESPAPPCLTLAGFKMAASEQREEQRKGADAPASPSRWLSTCCGLVHEGGEEGSVG